MQGDAGAVVYRRHTGTSLSWVWITAKYEDYAGVFLSLCNMQLKSKLDDANIS